MADVRVAIDSPLTAGRSEIYVRELGDRDGVPIIHLHGGWGYEVYPIAIQIAALPHTRIVIPDRSGYGRSTPVAELPWRFHEAAAVETEHVLDALGIASAILWGHSDGAVIAAWLALRTPERVRGLVLEALHFDREKPGSRQFFVDMAEDPTRFGPRIAELLERDHGARWREVLQMDGRAWLAIAARPDDLYDGRLAELRVPTLVLHGANDPRTEPGELDAIRAALPHATFAIIDDGGHCPHSHPRGAIPATTALLHFTSTLPR